MWWGVRKAVGSLVALRKESVDRNDKFQVAVHFDTLSLSARRAWIEIHRTINIQRPTASLSARRAWIEIRMALFPAPPTMSLSARRAWIEMQYDIEKC